MQRVPNDLNDETIRKEYVENHKKWFLKKHESSLKDFLESVAKKYDNVKQVNEQTTLLERNNKS